MPRTKGSKNKKTLLKEQALAAAARGRSPLAYMLDVMDGPDSPLSDPKMRLEAAKAAANYLHAKPSTSKPGDDARLIGASATASEVMPLTNNEWLLQLRAERAAEIAAGAYVPSNYIDQIITEIERRIKAGIGDRLTSYVPGTPTRTPEEEVRLDELRARVEAEWAESTEQALAEDRQRVVLERKQEPRDTSPPKGKRKEWGGLT